MLTQESQGVHRMEYQSTLQAMQPSAVMPVVFREYREGIRTESEEAKAESLRIQKLQQQIEEQAHAHRLEVERIRHEAFEEGRKKREAEESSLYAGTRAALERAIVSFAETRDAYLKDVEREVVGLALALAERILHREAQMDPLMLSGAVRVALGQLGESTEVRLRVPAAEQPLWSEMLRLMPHLPIRPEVIAEERMQTGECVIESKLGTVNLGVKAQLAEVERGFFDLLAQREVALHASDRG